MSVVRLGCVMWSSRAVCWSQALAPFPPLLAVPRSAVRQWRGRGGAVAGRRRGV